MPAVGSVACFPNAAIGVGFPGARSSERVAGIDPRVTPQV